MVGTLSSIDADAANTFTYSLANGPGDADNPSFNIVGNTPRASNNLNVAAKSSYSVRIRTTNQDGLFTEKSFLICVTDAAEEILIPGTNGNDTFVANYTGDGVQAQWLVTWNGTIVFNGVVPNGQNLWFDGLLGTDSLQIVGRTVDDSLTLDANRIAANGAWTRSTNVESFRITGASANGTIFLNNAADSLTDTVFADTDTDVLTGGTNQDWFFAALAEITDPTFAGATPDRRD